MILSEEQSLIQATARSFARERLAPGAEKRDREHAFPAAELAETELKMRALREALLG